LADGYRCCWAESDRVILGEVTHRKTHLTHGGVCVVVTVAAQSLRVRLR
jgi:hypothetical protein